MYTAGRVSTASQIGCPVNAEDSRLVLLYGLFCSPETATLAVGGITMCTRAPDT